MEDNMNKFRMKMALIEHQQVIANLNLNCPFCNIRLNRPELMLRHLTKEHDMGTYQAKFLAQKSLGWKLGDSDKVKFPKVIYRTRNRKSGNPSKQVYY
jgi:hypothetical protein